MATKKQTGSSFSITDDLFGSKDSISTSSSSSGIFDSIFPPPSTAGRRNFHGSEFLGSMQKQQSWSTGSGIADNGSKNWKGGSSNRSNVVVAATERNSNFQQKVEPSCPLSSSLYYGGQEDMYGTVTNQNGILKKTMTENDPYGNNSNDASRGNWWQGSLYY